MILIYNLGYLSKEFKSLRSSSILKVSITIFVCIIRRWIKNKDVNGRFKVL